jgi:hypothetical protein
MRYFDRYLVFLLVPTGPIPRKVGNIVPNRERETLLPNVHNRVAIRSSIAIIFFPGKNVY